MRRITARNHGEEEITFPLRMLDKDLQRRKVRRRRKRQRDERIKASGRMSWCRNKLKNAIQADWKIKANCAML